MNKITLPQLKRIVKEEVKSMNENIDHASIRDIVNAASKLLAAIETFKKSANGAMTNAVVEHVSSLEKTLTDMVSTPGSYIDKKSGVNKVTLKPIKDDEVSEHVSRAKKIIVNYVQSPTKSNEKVREAFEYVVNHGNIKELTKNLIENVLRDVEQGNHINVLDVQLIKRSLRA